MLTPLTIIRDLLFYGPGNMCERFLTIEQIKKQQMEIEIYEAKRKKEAEKEAKL
jgi:hypothetical protein